MSNKTKKRASKLSRKKKTLRSYISPVFAPSLQVSYGYDNFLFDTSGKKYIDFTSGIAVNAFGHKTSMISRALTTQLSKINHVSNLFSTSPQLKLTEALTLLANKSFNTQVYRSVFLSNSGTEANEAAIKFVLLAAKRIYNNAKKNKIIACVNGFHGRTLGALSVTQKYRKEFEPLMPNISFVRYNDVKELASLVDRDTAAIIVEPIQGEGGLDSISQKFVDKITAVSKQFGILVIADEIQAGLYRTGHAFASQKAGLKPHLITIAKSLGGGFPLGATITSQEIHDILNPGDHGSTTGGNPAICSVALSVVRALQSPLFTIQRARSARTLHRAIRALCSKHRGKHQELAPLGSGHLRGILLPKHIAVQDIITKAKKRGLLILRTGENSIRIAPALTCPPSIIRKGMRILRTVIFSTIKYSEQKPQQKAQE